MELDELKQAWQTLGRRLFVIDAETGKMRNLARPNGPFRDLSISSDSRFLAYVGSDDGGPRLIDRSCGSLQRGRIGRSAG